jgi:hypothetical protein
MSELVTPYYKDQLLKKHAKQPWGGAGKSWIPLLEKHLDMARVETSLDFGCGRHTYKQAMTELHPHIQVTEYDPGVAGYDALPQGEFDLVVCTDVMEHVEKEYTAATLVALRDYTKRVILFNIETNQCSSTLPDGRNTHINLRHVDEWTLLLNAVFKTAEKRPEFKMQIIERKGRLVCFLHRL